MRGLLRSTTAYKTFCRSGDAAHFSLVLFPDERNLRALLKECAKAFFGAEDGSRAAKLIDAESYSDCIILPAAGGKLTAELASSIAEESILRPVEGDKKLFVLDAFHTTTPLVQNKLLKLLEEPPEGVFFLAGATAAHAVLPTVLSRANTVTVPPFSEEEIAAALGRTHAGEAGIAEAAAACGGIYSVAEDLLSGGGEDFRLAARFLTEDHVEALCREIGEKKRVSFFAAVRLLLRDALFTASGQQRYAAVRSAEVRAIAARFGAGALAAALSFTAQAEREIQFNANFAQAALTLALRMNKERGIWQTLS